MNKELVDGLGYDESKQQYFTVVYGWNNIIPNQKKSSILELKSGITKFDVYHAMNASVLTRGKQFEQKALFGYKSDRKYLPKDITQDQANLIVRKMDLLFKQQMIELSYDVRSTRKGVGTEFYRVDKINGINEIKNHWNEALSRSIHLVTGKKDKLVTKVITFLGSQYSVTEIISDALKKMDKCIINIACGYGKGFLIYLAPFKWTKFKNKQFIIYYTHNIPATKQSALAHSKYDEGTKHQGKYKRVTICSENKISPELVEYGIENFSTNNASLYDFIVDSILNNTKVLFYVNKRSAEEFNKMFVKASKVFLNAPVPGIIFDEAHEFTGAISGQSTHPLVKPIGNVQVAVTATLRKRVSDTNRRWIYNDDIKYFGPVVVDITPQQAIEEGRNCEIKFKTVEVSNGRLGEEILANRAIDLEFKNKINNHTINRLIRGRVLHNVYTIVKSIVEDKCTHPISLAHQRVDVDHVMRVLEILQSIKVIPSKYKLVRGKREDGRDAVKKFNDASYSILVGNSWLLTGLDAPKTDAIIPLYDIGTVIGATQGIGRGQRIYKDKVLNVYITVDPSSNEVPIMLHVANEMMQGKNPYQPGAETDLELNPSEVIGSRRQRVITHEVDRDDTIIGSIRAMWDELYDNIHISNFGEVVCRIMSLKTSNKTKEECFELAKKCKSIAEFEQKYQHWIKWARTQEWYFELRAILGVSLEWTKQSAIAKIKEFKVLSECKVDSVGHRAYRWLYDNKFKNEINEHFKMKRVFEMKSQIKVDDKFILNYINKKQEKGITKFFPIRELFRAEGYSCSNERFKQLFETI